MAKIIGNPLFTGTIAGITIYKLGDKYVVRSKADYGKKEIMRNPKCRRQRENMKEFGHASHAGKEIRHAWKAMGNIALDATTHHRLNPILNKAIQKGGGTRGYQSLELTKFGQNLKGFTLGKDRSPKQHVSQSPQIQLIPATTAETQSQTKLQLTFPQKTHLNRQKAPAKARYYSIYLHVTALSDYHWDANEEKFRPEKPGGIESVAFHKTEKYPLNQQPGAIGTLQLPLPDNVQPGQTLMITWGIEYFAEKDGEPAQIIISKPRSKCRQTETYFEVYDAIPYHPPKAAHTPIGDEMRTPQQPEEATQNGKTNPENPRMATQTTQANAANKLNATQYGKTNLADEPERNRRKPGQPTSAHQRRAKNRKRR